jgi:hypothetical protein
MNNLQIVAGQRTPYVMLNYEKGELEFRGRSIPEDSVDFYTPVMDWLQEYSAQEKKPTTVKFYFEYINTSSSKCLLNIFECIENMHKNGWNVNVFWYEDEDGLEWDVDAYPFTFPMTICDAEELKHE